MIRIGYRSISELFQNYQRRLDIISPCEGSSPSYPSISGFDIQFTKVCSVHLTFDIISFLWDIFVPLRSFCIRCKFSQCLKKNVFLMKSYFYIMSAFFYNKSAEYLRYHLRSTESFYGFSCKYLVLLLLLCYGCCICLYFFRYYFESLDAFCFAAVFHISFCFYFCSFSLLYFGRASQAKDGWQLKQQFLVCIIKYLDR